MGLWIWMGGTTMKQHYSIGQFAKKTGTTIRALHYYDEINLLNPEVTASGRRIYHDTHLITLQKIITLKFLGYSLNQIKQFLKDESWDLHESLSLQREMMLQKRNQLDHIIKALDHALHIVDGEEKIDPAIFVAIINGIQEEEVHKKWLNNVFPEHVVNSIYDIPEAKKLEGEKIYADLVIKIKRMVSEGLSSSEPQALEIVQTIIKIATEVVGEDLEAIIKSATEEDLKNQPFPNPLSPEEEEWLSQAFEHFENTKKNLNKNEGGHLYE